MNLCFYSCDLADAVSEKKQIRRRGYQLSPPPSVSTARFSRPFRPGALRNTAKAKKGYASKRSDSLAVHCWPSVCPWRFCCGFVAVLPCPILWYMAHAIGSAVVAWRVCGGCVAVVWRLRGGFVGLRFASCVVALRPCSGSRFGGVAVMWRFCGGFVVVAWELTSPFRAHYMVQRLTSFSCFSVGFPLHWGQRQSRGGFVGGHVS